MASGGPGARRRGRIGIGELVPLGFAVALGIAVPVALGGARLDGVPRLLAPEQAYAGEDAACGGEEMPDPDRVITGSFGRAQEGTYVMLPFGVPSGTDAIRIKYCHDQPLLTSVPETDRVNKHTLDIGVYGPRSGRHDLWDEDEFRGWGGSSRKDVTISPEATIDPDPPPVAEEKTTVGFVPGRIRPGEWAVELGVAAIGAEHPAEDGEVGWRVEIDLIDDPVFSDEPFRPVRYSTEPAREGAGWYAGDFHVHARHSNPNDATMRETFEYAFDSLDSGAGLDFITLSDYVSTRAWDEIGAFQDDHPGKLIVRSAEVITYRGHVNNHGSARFVDYRTGPVYERKSEGELGLLRGPRPASEVMDDIRAGGGWSQINHPTIFPSDVPTFGNLCRGCSWEYDDAETDYAKVDAIEVATGPAGVRDESTPPPAPDSRPGPNPFTATALPFYDHAIDAGGPDANHIAAVGSSDSHEAGRPPDNLSAPIGQATTVVYAEELSEQGIGDAVRAGHTYVKMWGNDGPDLRFEARPAPLGADGPTAIMGDTLDTTEARFTARVMGLGRARARYPGEYALVVFRNSEPYSLDRIPPAQDSFERRFTAAGPARYRLQLMRLAEGIASIDAVSSPIYLQPGHPGALGTDRRRGGGSS